MRNKWWMVPILAGLPVLVAFAQGDAPVAGWGWHPPEDRPFPILAWRVPSALLLADASTEEMAAAGFNLCHFEAFNDPEKNEAARSFALKHGIGIVLIDRRLNWREKDAEKKRSNLDALIKEWTQKPALAAYRLQDEPSASDFAALATMRDVLALLDPERWSFVNLYPNYASSGQLGVQTYAEYVSRFIEVFRPQVLSFDHYPITGNKRVRPQFFENLETIRAASLRAGVPFWAFALSTAHASYPPPTEGHLRFQLYSDLAYGAKGVQYYTYGPKEDDAGLIARGGSRTSVYEVARRINGEIQNMGPLLLRLRSTAVLHTSPAPRATREFRGHDELQLHSGAPALFGFFDGPVGRKFLMVVNRDPEGVASMALTFRNDLLAIGEIDRSSKDSTARPLILNGRDLSLSLAAGDGRLFELKTNR
jgi:hypothetical protein